MASPELRAYTPSWRERLAGAFSRMLPGDESRSSAAMGRKIAELTDVIPPVGAFTYGNDAYRAAERGDKMAAAGNAGMAVLSMLPMGKLDKMRGIFGTRSPYEAIPGMPSTFKLPGGEVMDAKPIPAVVDAARDYAKSRGMTHQIPESFPTLDRDRAASIANWYDQVPDGAGTPEVMNAYKALADETLGQYDALANRGIAFEFMKKGPDGQIIDPYAASPSLGYKDLADRGRLEIFPTEAGYGTLNATTQNPLLAYSGRNFGDQPATFNDLFRAVHDAYGHFGYGNSFFRAPGEERAWNLHSMMFSPQAKGAMTAETRGQNSWVNAGPYGRQNAAASGADTVYADQKAVNAPDWVQTDTRLKGRNADHYIPGVETVGPAPAPALAGMSRDDEDGAFTWGP